MLELHDILSIPPLDPVSFTTLDYDEVHRLWHVDKGTKGGGGRGKGRIGKGMLTRVANIFDRINLASRTNDSRLCD